MLKFLVVKIKFALLFIKLPVVHLAQINF